MTETQLKHINDIISAYIDGKQIEYFTETKKWEVIDNICNAKLWEDPDNYRVKSEPTYRAFKDAEECTKEMLKHSPYAWVQVNYSSYHYSIIGISNRGVVFISAAGEIETRSFDYALKNFTFKDCSNQPFGIKIETL